MNISLSSILSVALLSSALTLGAAKGNAQQATFHLPVEAHWNSAILEPGDYRLATPTLGVNEPAFVIRGTSASVYALPMVANIQATSNSSYLVLQKVNGEYFVTAYSSGAAGKNYLFATPKQARHQTVAKTESTLVAVTNSALK